MDIQIVLKRKILEKDIEKQIIDWLKLKGFFVWKQKTTGTYDPRKKVFRSNPQMKTGVSDVLGILPEGRFLAIEVKVPGNKPTKDQIEFTNQINLYGGLAFVADDLQIVIDRFKAEKLIK